MTACPLEKLKEETMSKGKTKKLEELLQNPVFLLNMDKLDEKRRTQVIKVFEAFHTTPRTMMEAEVASGVMRSNICYFVRDLRKSGLIAELNKRPCKITRHKATEYTTDPARFPFNPQKKIFEGISPTGNEGQNNASKSLAA